MKEIVFILWGLTICLGVSATNVYVKSGAVAGDGSKSAPFGAIQDAVDLLQAGDTCFVGAGSFHEEVVLTGLTGTESTPIVITSWRQSKAKMDGTKLLTLDWEVHAPNVYKSYCADTIWQLFRGGKEQVMARWPNGQFEDESIYNYSSWAHADATKGLNNGQTYDPAIASAGFDATGAVGVLNFASFKTYARYITNHSAGLADFEYDSIPKNAFRDKHHYYYLECALQLLDTENEWYYDIETDTLYTYGTSVDVLNNSQFRGKTQSFAFRVEGSEYVKIEDIDFFATTVYLYKSKYITVEGANFDHPNCSKRMLKNFGKPDVTTIYQQGKTTDSYCSFKSCTFAYTDAEALRIKGKGNKVEDCLFHHIDYSVCELEGLMVTININGIQNKFSHNTIYKTGASSIIVPGDEPIFTYNDITNTGFLQSDGAVLQGTKSTVYKADLSYNWIYETPKYALRFDAPGGDPGQAGSEGTMHHNVFWGTNGTMVKGDYHYINNNTGFLNAKNDLIILAEDGSNVNSHINNNLAQKIAGHRSSSITNYPVPAIDFAYNWNGYEEGGAKAYEQVRDYHNLDFRPHPELIDSGVALPNHMHGALAFVGDAPDIGAYEDDSTYWMPGQRLESVYRTVPPQGAGNVQVDADLMWLEALDAESYSVYFSEYYSQVRNRKANCKTDVTGKTFLGLDSLETGTTYFWCVDAIQANGNVLESDIFWFTAAADAFLPDTIITQTINLKAGWNLVSLYVQPIDNRTSSVFPNAHIVKDAGSFSVADRPDHLNLLKEIAPVQGLLVLQMADESVEVTGSLAIEPLLPLRIIKGWNLVGVAEDTPVVDLPASILEVKGSEQFYIPGNAQSSLSELKQGKAYYIYSE